ncbi:hypothetical protein [uncultured Pontibacter sp.]|uniref:hypothetical protein n=1 Tax=uncultured Pontibacter sp. TaxID=453356 RepID=UPI002638354B|nr:hypothetical protein [uncultured Pontibacter sp.]
MEMLLTEYKEISNNMRAFWNVRLTILGLIASLISILLALLETSNIVQLLIIEGSLLLIITGSVTIHISITRHLVIYGIRLSEIEGIFVKKGFWHKWGAYVKKHPNVTNTRAIAVADQLLNLVVLVYIIWMNTAFLESKNLVGLSATGLLFAIAVFNALYIRRNLNPGSHWIKMKMDWKNMETISAQSDIN